jgi:hypothetical protein
MGSRGIRRRKPVRHIRQGPGGTLPYGDPPGAIGSTGLGGLSEYSPMGALRLGFAFIDSLHRRVQRRRQERLRRRYR